MRALSQERIDLIDAVVAEANAEGITASLLEKDEHLTDALRALFALRLEGLQLVFCGGTSLSKAHGLIERMSEDADLKIVFVPPALDLSKSQRRVRLRKLRETVAATLESLGFEQDLEQARALNGNQYMQSHWAYKRHYDSVSGLRPNLQLELSVRRPIVNPDLCELDALTNRLAKRAGKLFKVPTVCVAETQAEKVLSFLRRFAQHRSGQMKQPWDQALVRHIYDVHCIHIAKPVFLEQTVSMFAQLVRGDVQEFGRQFPEFGENPAMVLVDALSRCEHDAQTHKEYSEHLLPLVYGNHRPDFKVAFASFQHVAQRALPTLVAQ